MIETFFGTDRLSTGSALFVAWCIGLAFGFVLERAGFGSSRRLAGIFYFRDMAVLKVMFSAVLVAMLGVQYCLRLGWLSNEQLFLMPSVYGAQIVGGLIFGIGFVCSGWCPGTAAVGLASGRGDAAVFLGGAMAGSSLFNDMFGMMKGLYHWGDSGVRFAWQSFHISAGTFALGFTVTAVVCFWGAEYIEKRVARTGMYWGSSFLQAFSVILIIVAVGLVALEHGTPIVEAAPLSSLLDEQSVLAAIENGEDHIDPEDLADRLMDDPAGLTLVDVRSAEEYGVFHIRGAVHIPMSKLPDALAATRSDRIIVLYSDGMVHPAQARDSLLRLGVRNIYILSEGLDGFTERVLKPVSLRLEPISPEQASKISAWRRYFLPQQSTTQAQLRSAPATGEAAASISAPGGRLIETAWLEENLKKPTVRVIEVRSQPAYNSRHIPGAVCLSIESVRGVVNGVSSMLLPGDILARHASLMGIRSDDTVVIVPEEKPLDGTLIAMAFARLGHRSYGILDGGFARWIAEARPITTELPEIIESRYPASPPDAFTVDYKQVLQASSNPNAIILDVRPTDYFAGAKVDEARGGHIPNAINRPFTEDTAKTGASTALKPIPDLRAAYERIIPNRDSKVIVHCRTGHQASQTFFVLRDLLGYKNVSWYDAGWSEWAARKELPVEP